MQVSLGGHGDLELPDSVFQNIRKAHGPLADGWLAQLGSILANVLSSLNAELAPGKPSLSYHLVFFAEQADGREIVIKCTVPNWEQRPEVAGVGVLSDAGIGPQLLWQDLDRGVLVMERVRPGTNMPTVIPSLADDARITRGIAALASRMARGAQVGDRHDDLLSVPFYSRALDEVDERSSLWPHHLDDIQRALELRAALLADPDRHDVFLHGDLHHYNVLKHDVNGWSVIDPKGLCGPAGYDFGAYTYNPMGIERHPQLTALTRQRVDIWSATTGIPWEAVRSWGYVAAMLSASWSAENGGDGWQGAVKIAQTLRTL